MKDIRHATPIKPSKTYLECMAMLDESQRSIDRFGELNRELQEITNRAKRLLTKDNQ